MGWRPCGIPGRSSSSRRTRLRDLGDSVLWLGHVKMRGGTSHVELDQEFAVHSLLSDGKVIRVQAFLSWREALEAVGLAE